MDLLLWRHAEAEDGFPDAQRRLTARGEKQAKQVAAWIKEHAPQALTVIVSPAQRCQQTARALGLPFVTSDKISTAADAADLIAAVGWSNDKREAKADAPSGGRKRAVLVVGHQPTLGRVAALLLSGQEAEWTVKKGALWWLRRRVRDDAEHAEQTVVQAVVAPDLV